MDSTVDFDGRCYNSGNSIPRWLQYGHSQRSSRRESFIITTLSFILNQFDEY